MIELLLEAERAMSLGRTDRADRLFRQAADADPRNSIAVVGLARVALERGDEAGALALARRALEIDADNPAARRLADRLVEVMTYRGKGPAAEEAKEDAAADATTGSAVTPPADPASATPAEATDPAPARGSGVVSAPDGTAAPASAPERRGLLHRLLGR